MTFLGGTTIIDVINDLHQRGERITEGRSERLQDALDRHYLHSDAMTEAEYDDLTRKLESITRYE